MNFCFLSLTGWTIYRCLNKFWIFLSSRPILQRPLLNICATNSNRKSKWIHDKAKVSIFSPYLLILPWCVSEWVRERELRENVFVCACERTRIRYSMSIYEPVWWGTEQWGTTCSHTAKDTIFWSPDGERDTKRPQWTSACIAEWERATFVRPLLEDQDLV